MKIALLSFVSPGNQTCLIDGARTLKVVQCGSEVDTPLPPFLRGRTSRRLEDGHWNLGIGQPLGLLIRG